MRSNASIFAALLLLAGCGGSRGHAEYAPESAGSQPMGSIAAQSWSPREEGAPPRYRQPPVRQQSQAQPGHDVQETETWRAADGSIRSRPVRAPAPESAPPEPEPQPQWAEPQPAAPGASYAAPGTGYAAPVPQQVPPPATRQESYADPAAGATGPRGSSQPGPGETRYDEIGYAGVRPVSGGGAMDEAVVAVHRSLPANSYVEVTSLETGRTILVLVTGAMGPGADHPIDLSAGAARLLGATGESVPVRIRGVTPPATDQTALRAGRPAAERPDAPQVLLNALRKHLPGAPGLAGRTPAPAPSYTAPRAAAPRTVPPRPAPVARAPAGRGYFVQIAALSSAGRAQALAQSMGGFVKPGGGLYRVQLGPFANQAQAEAARRRAAGAGYGDARVLAN